MTDPVIASRQRAICTLLVPPLVLLQTSGVLAQQLGLGRDDGIDFLRVGLALAACLAISILAALFLKKRLQGGLVLRKMTGARRLQLDETLRIGTQADICIVSCDGEELLLVSSPHGVKLLRALGPKCDVASP